MRVSSLISGTNPVKYGIICRVNKEYYIFSPSILKIYRVGGIFIYSCGFFYAGFVRFV